MALSREAWDAALVSIGTRLRALEAIQADFEALIALGTSQALDVIATNVEPQLTAMSAAVAALQADVAEAEDVITALITGSVPASAVAETADRIWFTPALAASLAGKQAGSPKLSALAALSLAANKLLYATGAETLAATDLSDFARQLLDDADPAAMRTTIGAADAGRTIGAGGLATGGGDLSANRTITVPAASQAEAEAGADNAKAMTALRTAQQVSARLATQAEAEARSNNSKLLTPQRGAQLVEAHPDFMRRLASGSGSNFGYLLLDLGAHITAGRRKFRLKIHNYRTVVDDFKLVMSVSANGGASYPADIYKYTHLNFGEEFAEAWSTGTTTDDAAVILESISNGSGNESSGWIDFECGSGHFDFTSQMFCYWAGGFGAGMQMSAGKVGLANVNYLRFETYTGNIASAAWSLYGAA